MHEKKYPFLSYIYQRRKLNISIFIIYIFLFTGIVFLLMPLEYTSGVSILPSAANFSEGLVGKLGGLGKIAGLDLGGGSLARSQEMYMGIIYSKRLLDEVVEHPYVFKEDDKEINTNLIDYFEIEEEDNREVIEKVLKKMREDVVVVDIDPDNDILYLDVTTENPFLSAQVANKTIEILNEIVRTEVYKEYRQKLGYLEIRLTEIGDSLKIAENELKFFLETNTDPTLPSFQVEQIRLKRNLQIQTELLIEFRKQLEIFIADNMINLADIKVLDEAYPPYRKSRPKRALLLISFVLLAMFLQVGVNGFVVVLKNFKKDFYGNLP